MLLVRAVAWTVLMVIVVLTVVPPGFRPVTAVPHGIEHAAAFLVTGILFGAAYVGREWLVSAGAVVFCAAIEAVQLFVPGRHARISDFVVDTAAGVAGVFLGMFARRVGANFAKLPSLPRRS
jgi:VanZ family protein